MDDYSRQSLLDDYNHAGKGPDPRVDASGWIGDNPGTGLGQHFAAISIIAAAAAMYHYGGVAYLGQLYSKWANGCGGGPGPAAGSVPRQLVVRKRLLQQAAEVHVLPPLTFP